MMSDQLIAEPKRHLATGIAPEAIHLAYRIGDERYTLSYPRNERGAVRALIAVQHWLDADCNFDRRACDEVCAKVELLSEFCCEGR